MVCLQMSPNLFGTPACWWRKRVGLFPKRVKLSCRVRRAVKADLIRASVHDECPGSMKITTDLDDMSDCKTASGIDGPNEYLS